MVLVKAAAFDEVAVALLGEEELPVAARLVTHFLLFRLFDIWKPGVVDAAQRLPGGWGVVMDDVLAGLLAALLAWPLDQWLGTRSLAQPSLWGG